MFLTAMDEHPYDGKAEEENGKEGKHKDKLSITYPPHHMYT